MHVVAVRSTVLVHNAATQLPITSNVQTCLYLNKWPGHRAVVYITRISSDGKQMSRVSWPDSDLLLSMVQVPTAGAAMDFSNQYIRVMHDEYVNRWLFDLMTISSSTTVPQTMHSSMSRVCNRYVHPVGQQLWYQH